MGYKLNLPRYMQPKVTVNKVHRMLKFLYPHQTDDKSHNKVRGQSESFN